MSPLTDKNRDILLRLARSAIASELIKDAGIERPGNIPDQLEEKRGGFVTLHSSGLLRGCIGTIEPVKSLLTCVEDNALNAAFRDPRFPPLKLAEFSKVNIEISVLTVPRELTFKDGEDLKRQLKPGIHGVIVSRSWQSATFLPQVWKQLPETEVFLAHLCEKGGMAGTAWQDRDTTVKVYEAEYFSEK